MLNLTTTIFVDTGHSEEDIYHGENYQFTLILKNVDENTEKLADSLYEAGCDDALINFRNGSVYLDFDRKAISLENALISAIKNVESAYVENSEGNYCTTP